MIVTRNEQIRPFDVDDSLVIHTESYIKPEEIVRVIDPLDYKKMIVMRMNLPMMRILREEYSRGGYIIVWSRGGYQWAQNVINALGLEQYVHQVMTKPIVYFDDKPVKKWLKDRVYLSPDVPYKGHKYGNR